MTEEKVCETVESRKSLLSFILYFVKRYKFVFCLALIVMFLRNEGSLFLPNYVLKYVIDGLTAGKLTFKTTMVCF